MTTLNLFNETTSPLSLDEASLLSCFKSIVTDHDFDAGWLNVILLSESDHTEMNKQHLSHDYATDVITFSFNEGNVINGEIYINPDMAKKNASEYEVSLINEVHRLVVHGILHLIGYDDHTPEQKAAMSRLEDKYLNSFM